MKVGQILARNLVVLCLLEVRVREVDQGASQAAVLDLGHVQGQDLDPDQLQDQDQCQDQDLGQDLDQDQHLDPEVLSQDQGQGLHLDPEPLNHGQDQGQGQHQDPEPLSMGQGQGQGQDQVLDRLHCQNLGLVQNHLQGLAQGRTALLAHTPEVRKLTKKVQIVRWRKIVVVQIMRTNLGQEMKKLEQVTKKTRHVFIYVYIMCTEVFLVTFSAETDVNTFPFISSV